jgi:hypothetical protein
MQTRSLATSDRDHRVDGGDAGLNGCVDVLAANHTGRDALDRTVNARLDRSLAVDRLAQRVDHPPHQPVTDRDRGDAPGPRDDHAFLDPGVVAHDDHADGVHLQAEGDSHHAVGEAHELLGANIRQSGDPRDAVAGLQDRSDVLDLDGGRESFDLAAEFSRQVLERVRHQASRTGLGLVHHHPAAAAGQTCRRGRRAPLPSRGSGMNVGMITEGLRFVKPFTIRGC